MQTPKPRPEWSVVREATGRLALSYRYQPPPDTDPGRITRTGPPPRWALLLLMAPIMAVGLLLGDTALLESARVLGCLILLTDHVVGSDDHGAWLTAGSPGGSTWEPCYHCGLPARRHPHSGCGTPLLLSERHAP